MFYNKVRLPFYLHRPQYSVQEEIYTKSNGIRHVAKSIISEEWEGVVDWVNQDTHKKLNIALRHDVVYLQNLNYNFYFRLTGGYDIEWATVPKVKIGNAKFKGVNEDFYEMNNRCGQCMEGGQYLVANDDLPNDYFTDGAEFTINVAANDSICCDNPIFDLVYVDYSIIQWAGLSNDGIFSGVLFNPVPTGQKLVARYKVTCNGKSDEADVYLNLQGTGSSESECLPPANLTATPINQQATTVDMKITWTAPTPPPLFGYTGRLEIKVSGLWGFVQNFGTTNTFFIFQNLNLNSEYRIIMTAHCSEYNNSETVLFEFSTPPGEPPVEIGNINLEVETTVTELNNLYTIIARLTNPPFPITLTTAINIAVQLNVDGVVMLTSVTLQANERVGYSTDYIAGLSGGTAVIDYAYPTPDNATGTDSQQYNILVTY